MKAGSKSTLENMFSSARHLVSAAGLIAISYFGQGCDLLTPQNVAGPLPERPKTECPSLRRASIEDSLIISVPGTNYSKIILTDEDFPRYGLKPAGNPQSVIGYTPVTIDVRDLGTDALVSNPVVIYYNRTPTKLYTSTNGSVVINNNPTAIREEDPCLADALAKQAEGPDPLVLPSNVTVYTMPFDSLLFVMGNRYNPYLQKPWPNGYPAKTTFTNRGNITDANYQRMIDKLLSVNTQFGMNLVEYVPDSTAETVVIRLNSKGSQTQSRKHMTIANFFNYPQAGEGDLAHELDWHAILGIMIEGDFREGGVGGLADDKPSYQEIMLGRGANVPRLHGLPPIDWSNYSSN